MRLKDEKHIKLLVQCKYFTHCKVREILGSTKDLQNSNSGDKTDRRPVEASIVDDQEA